MSEIAFIAIHGSILLLLSFVPAAADILSTHSVVDYTKLAGQEIALTPIIIMLEACVAQFSNRFSGKTGRLMLLGWSLLIIPLVLITLVDFRLTLMLGYHVDLSVVHYGLRELSNIISMITSEIGLTTVVIILTALFGSFSLAASSQQLSNKHPFLIKLISYIAIPLIVIIFLSSGRCPGSLISPSFLPTCREARAVGASAGSISANKVASLLSLMRSLRESSHSFSGPSSLTTTGDSNLDNVVIIIVESFRTDAATPYSPAVENTPFINKLASEGLLVEKGYVDFPHTSKSIVAINCGIPPYPRMRIREGEKHPLPVKCLPKLLEPLGYASGFFQTATEKFEKRNVVADNIGFQHFTSQESIDLSGWDHINYFGYEDRAMLKPITQWVDQQDSPFVLSIMTLSSHHPYEPPSSWRQKLYTTKRTWNGYLNTLAYTDQFIRELFQEFERRKLLDKTLFIIVGDHGVSLGEFDNNAPLDKNVRIPYILWSKHLIPKHQVIHGIRQHSDIVPTIADLFNLEPVGDQFFGQSILQPTRGWAPIVCKRSDCVALAIDDFIYVFHPQANTAGLYDYQRDLKHRRNLISILPIGLVMSTNNYLRQWKSDLFAYYLRN